jgi:hypothetical protein
MVSEHLPDDSDEFARTVPRVLCGFFLLFTCKVDPLKFINWLMPQISGEGMYELLLDAVQKHGFKSEFRIRRCGYEDQENLSGYGRRAGRF